MLGGGSLELCRLEALWHRAKAPHLTACWGGVEWHAAPHGDTERERRGERQKSTWQTWRKRPAPPPVNAMFRRGGGGGVERLEKTGDRAEDKLGPRESEQWQVQKEERAVANREKRKPSGKKLYNTNRKQSVYGSRGVWWTSEGWGRGTVRQSHRSTGWADRRKSLWSLFLSSFSYSCAGLHLTPPPLPPTPPSPLPPPLHR